MNAKRRKIERATIWLYRIFDIFQILTPKTQSFDFSKTNGYKIQNFGGIQKNGLYVVNLHTDNIHRKFQNNIFIFGCAMVKKDNGDDVTFFEMQFLAFLLAVRENK